MTAAGRASPPVAAASVWVLTDGKAGDEEPCIGVAEALGVTPDIRRVRPRAPWSWLMPWGPIDPAEAPPRTGSPLAPPYPDVVIASGRRAVPYLRLIKRRSGGRTLTVLLKDPRNGRGAADLIWVPDYDGLRGPNVVTSLTTPHRLSAVRLAAARAAPDPRLAGLALPRVAVLAGGDSRHVQFGNEDITRLVTTLSALDCNVSLMITSSRRTPPRLQEALRHLAAERGGFYWDGTGRNPYVDILALAEAVVVTADSANMVGEAASTGAPVLLFDLPGGYEKHRFLFSELERYGALRPFTGRLERFTYPPLDSTGFVADAVRRALAGRGIRFAADPIAPIEVTSP